MGRKEITVREWIVPDNDIGVDGAYFDYQELLRCKECKNYITDDGIGIMCQMHYYRVKPTDFCSWAERKEE